MSQYKTASMSLRSSAAMPLKSSSAMPTRSSGSNPKVVMKSTVSNDKDEKIIVVKSKVDHRRVSKPRVSAFGEKPLIEKPNPVSEKKPKSAVIEKSVTDEDYINRSIISNFRKVEVVEQVANYMSSQTDINANMRSLLIDWLVDVGRKFQLLDETLFIAVTVMDKFLEKRIVSRSKLQLIGATAMYIASKYEEMFYPEIQDFIYLGDNSFTFEEMLRMESIILNTIGFKVTFPTSNKFLDYFVVKTSCDEETAKFSKYLIEKSLLEYNMMIHLPSKIASAAIYLANEKAGRPGWTETLGNCINYSEKDLIGCVEDLKLILSTLNPKLTSIDRKYKIKK
jgi:hypothetical protein